MRRLMIGWCAGLALGLTVGSGLGADPPEEWDSLYQWFSVPLTVRGLPASGPPVPVECRADFSEMLQRMKVSGAVDERSLRLIQVAQDGIRAERPVQFLAEDQQPTADRRFLPGTVPKVSYVAEFAAGETPAHLKVQGTLVWFAEAGADGRANYELLFGVPRRGRAVQVPYPPHNLRMFDDAGRATPVRHFPVMQIRPQWPLEGTLDVTEAGRLVTTYHVGPTPQAAREPALALRRPFFYPVIGPDGFGLTEFGKAHDPTGSHRHHYSLWIAHASVAGHDYWSDQGGVIASAGWKLLEDGPVFCRLIQQTRWTDGETDYLDERRSVTVFTAAEDFRLIDLDLEYSPAGSEPVELGQTSFGFLAVRVAQSMTPFDGGGEIRNARGDRNEQNAHLQRAQWLDQSGPLAPGTWGGIAMLDHPRNANHPTGWHCRNDGWAGASFNLDRAHTIRPGSPLRLRYRLVLHRGNAAEANVAGHWRAYAAEPAIQIGQARELNSP